MRPGSVRPEDGSLENGRPGSPTCLVVGSYPPAPGPAAVATVAAVRRAWADGFEVVVASPRPSAAQLVIPVAGAAVGRALARLQSPSRAGVGTVLTSGTGFVSAPGSGAAGGGTALARPFAEVVVCLEPCWPLGRGRRPASGRPVGQAELERAARSLAAALSGFERATLVVTGDLGVGRDVLAVLWPAVHKVTASSEEIAAVLRAAGAPSVSFAGEPLAGSGLSWAGAVSPLEPAELLLVARGRRLIGSTARKVLGPRAPAVRAYLQRAWIRAKTDLARARNAVKPPPPG